MLRIGSNITAMQVQRRLAEVSYDSSRSLERLSSGARINRASDDAAGLAIASALKSQTRVYTQALRNGNDAISALSVQDAALSQLSDVVTRLKELATQASNGSFSRIQRLALDKEGAQLVEEFNRTVAATSFNGIALLSGSLSSVGIQLGYGTQGMIGVSLNRGLRRNIAEGFSFRQSNDFQGTTVNQNSALGDLNGDGYADVVRVTGLGQIDIYNGGPSGLTTLFPDSQVAVNNLGGATSISIVDLNGDGRPDLLASDGTYSSTLIAQGDGSFVESSSTPEVGFTAGGARAPGPRVADINGDGFVDLVGVGVNGTTLNIALGDGSGNFQSVSTTDLLGDTIVGMELGDIDGDGVIDIVEIGAGGLATRKGNGDGTFQGFQVVDNTVTDAFSFAVGDTNYDGVADIVVNGPTLRLFRGRGDGGFQSAVALGSGSAHATVAILDMDGDGVADIVAGRANSTALIHYGKGDGTFENATSAGIGNVRDLKFGDINGDGVLDILGTNDGFSTAYSNLNDSSFLGYFGVSAQTSTIERLNLTTRADALSSLSSLDDILQRLAQDRGSLGASQSRIQTALAVVLARRDTGEGAASRILDIDVASESADLTRRTILQQTAASLLGQANQAPALALQLLRT